MKRLLVFATVFALCLVTSGALLAQNSSFIGTWKLNPAKSKFTAGAPPKEEMTTIQMIGDQQQTTASGTAADGSALSLKYEVPEKGGAGKVLVGPFDAISGKRIDDNTSEVTYTKGGKEIRTTRGVVSKDGKTMRVTIKGQDAQGKPAAGVLVFEKQ
jgi:hypothetical protein